MRRRATPAEYSAAQASPKNTTPKTSAKMMTPTVSLKAHATNRLRPDAAEESTAPPSRKVGRPKGLPLYPGSTRAASMRARRSMWCSGLPHTEFASRRS